MQPFCTFKISVLLCLGFALIISAEHVVVDHHSKLQKIPKCIKVSPNTGVNISCSSFRNGRMVPDFHFHQYKVDGTLVRNLTFNELRIGSHEGKYTDNLNFTVQHSNRNNFINGHLNFRQFNESQLGIWSCFYSYPGSMTKFAQMSRIFSKTCGSLPIVHKEKVKIWMDSEKEQIKISVPFIADIDSTSFWLIKSLQLPNKTETIHLSTGNDNDRLYTYELIKKENYSIAALTFPYTGMAMESLFEFHFEDYFGTGVVRARIPRETRNSLEIIYLTIIMIFQVMLVFAFILLIIKVTIWHKNFQSYKRMKQYDEKPILTKRHSSYCLNGNGLMYSKKYGRSVLI